MTSTVAGRGQPRLQAGSLRLIWGAFLHTRSFVPGCVSRSLLTASFQGQVAAHLSVFLQLCSFWVMFGFLVLGVYGFSQIWEVWPHAGCPSVVESLLFRAILRRVLWGTGCPAVLTAMSFCPAPSCVSSVVVLSRSMALAPAPFSTWCVAPASVGCAGGSSPYRSTCCCPMRPCCPALLPAQGWFTTGQTPHLRRWHQTWSHAFDPWGPCSRLVGNLGLSDPVLILL